MKAIPAGLEKKAIGLGTLAHGVGAALGGHVGTNLAGLASHGGLNSAEMLAHKGLQQGLGGAKMNPLARLSTRLLGGAEALTAYDTAHELASRIQHLPTAQQRAILAAGNIPGRAAISANTPVFGALQAAVGHELAGTAPELMRKAPIRSGVAGVGDRLKDWVGRVYHGGLDKMTNLTNTQFDTTGKKVVTGLAGAAPAVAFAAADPMGALGHYAINASRMAGVHTDWGKNLALGQVQKGLRGEQVSPISHTMQQVLISPGFTEARDIGSSMRNNLGANLGQYGTDMANRAGAMKVDAKGLGNMGASQGHDVAKHIVGGGALPASTAKAIAPQPVPPKQKGSGLSLSPVGLINSSLAAGQLMEPKTASYWRMSCKLADGSAHEEEGYEHGGVLYHPAHRRSYYRRPAGGGLSAAVALGLLASRFDQGGL